MAAVSYLLGKAFDRDPFLIFRLRGMDREEFIWGEIPLVKALKPSSQSAVREAEQFLIGEK